MATLALASAGNMVGGLLLPGLGGTIGAAIGGIGGAYLDASLVNKLSGPQINEGPRIQDLLVTASTEGAPIARVFGRMRLGGQIIWATKIKETQSVEKVKEKGGKGGGSSSKSFNVTYSYSGTFAVAFCEGPIVSIARVWADGKPINLADYTHRIYVGDETQTPDPKIVAVEGSAPAYRGLAYLVFEDMPLADFGNRIPVITAEIVRQPPASGPRLEELITAVTLIPSMGEFVYATTPVNVSTYGSLTPQNTYSGGVDLIAALDQLEEAAPNCNRVSLVVAWQGTDLRAGECEIVPKAETATKTTTGMTWIVAGLTRETAQIVHLSGSGNPLIGGAPSDLSVVQAIQEIKDRGFEVTLYPFVMMDIVEGNGLPDPYGRAEQPAFPWRGRITCHPAPGQPGSPDKTATAASQIDAFFGSVAPADLTWTGATVTSSVAEWSFRRFVLHCAKLAQAAGGVDAFLIGSELIGLTTVRSDATTFPAVAKLKTLAADVRSILGSGTKIGYAADWTEYGPYRPADGSGDLLFALDPLWSDSNIDFVGIDNYLPLADWRAGNSHVDALAGAPSIYDLDYLQGNIEGGELFAWYYPTRADRDAQNRVTITDGAYAEPWVHRIKDIRSWWANAHHDRPGGVRTASATAWVPQSKPIRFTELGCPSIDKGPNQPNVFVDPKSSESFAPYYSTGRRDLAAQRAYLTAVLDYWDPANGNNPTSSVYGGPMIDRDNIAVWCWDARPYPDFPLRGNVWGDVDNYRLGHWISGRLGLAPLADVVAELCDGLGVEVDTSGLYGLVQGYALDRIMAPREAIAPLQIVHFFDGIESGGQIVFRHRDRDAVATYAPAELVARDQSKSGSDYSLGRGQESELPAIAKLHFLDGERDYRPGAVEARRLKGSSQRVIEESVNIVLDSAAAQGIAETLLFEAHIGRETSDVTLPPSALALDPGDIVTLDIDGVSRDVRLDQIGIDNGRPARGTRTDAAVYDWPDGGLTTRVLPLPAATGVPLFTFLDLPLLGDSAVAHAPYIAAYGEPWAPVAVYRSPTESGFTLDATVTARSILARLTADLPAGPTDRWDRVNTIEIEVPAGAELASAEEIAVLGGANAAALLTPSGNWEVLQWCNVELVSTGHYKLTKLLRGQLGTEFAIGDPTLAGATFVVLSEALVQSGIPLASRNLPIVWTWGPASRSPGDPTYTTDTLTFAGVGLRPYAPAHLRGARVAGDVVLTWIRRTRINGDAWEQTEVPLGEEAEAYEVEIRDGDGTVVRTLSAATQTVTYTAAMEAEDFGSAPSTLDVTVYQLSALYGRGAPARKTLNV